MHYKYYLFQDFIKTLKLAFPMIIGQIVGLSMSFIDAAILGRGVGTEALAALGLATSIIYIFIISGFGFTSAISILVSQSWGANKRDLLVPVLKHGLIICLLYTFIMLLLLFFFMEHAEYFHYFGQPEHVVTLAKPYIYLLSTAFIFTFYNSCTRSYCQGQNIVWFPLAILSSTVVLNIFFNWLFIFGKLGFPQMGLLGAGIGSILSQICGTILITLILDRSSKYKYSFNQLLTGSIQVSLFKKILSLGFPLYLEILAEVSGLSLIAFMIGSLGDTALAAHHGASEVSILSYIIVMATSNAAAIRIGQASGAHDVALLSKIKRSSLLFSLLVGILFTFIFIGLRNQLPYIYTQDIGVVKVSALIFIFMGAYQIINMLAVMSSGLLNGMGQVKIPMKASLLGKLFVMVPLGYLLGLYCGKGVAGLWMAITAGIHVFGLIVLIRVLRIRHEKAEV